MILGPDSHSHSGLISSVVPESLADRVGLQRGDEVAAINGHLLRDVIDVRCYASEALLRLQVRREGKPLVFEVERRYDVPLGIEFARPVFDRVRRCNNGCEFCFVSQMPRGLRRSLYVKDDDYRYSFLFGSYVTLTNLTEDDWRRIEEQHLSPLYVSVHATEPDLRRRLLRNPAAPDILPQLRRLASIDVEVHAQIVVRPGTNDGGHLDRSISELSELHPSVCSVSVVPLGLTKYHRFTCRLPTGAEMRDVFDRASSWQVRLRERLGVAFAYLSDEWYLRLDEKVPPAEHYDGFDLTENGVGLVRGFLEAGARRLRSRISELDSPTIATGTLFAPVLRSAVVGLHADLVPVVNDFFGESVTVAGLLTAEDVITQLKDRDLGDTVVLPPPMFGGPEGQSVDDMWPGDVSDALGRPVIGRPAAESPVSGWPGHV